MKTFHVGALAYVLHEISAAWSGANLAVLHNITEAEALGPINAQASKAIDAAEMFFKKWPLGDCLDDVLSAKHRLTLPYTGPSAMSAIFGRLEEGIMTAAKNVTFLLLTPPERATDYEVPLGRWGGAAAKFPAASMEAASRCFALDEWDASVFHSMRVLEKGLRWFAGQINAGPFPLTLKKPIELEQWGNIIENIQARIDDEMGPPPKGQPSRSQKTPERGEELAFYSRAAKELAYFKEAWRNHIMHDRNAPHDDGTARTVLDHVAAFMQVLATRA